MANPGDQLTLDGSNIPRWVAPLAVSWNETPSGTVDGVNDTFTLADPPNPASSLMLFRNGVLQRGGGVDYALTSATIVFAASEIPSTGDLLIATYQIS